jgi:hypothetical protein
MVLGHTSPGVRYIVPDFLTTCPVVEIISYRDLLGIEELPIAIDV